MIDLIYNFILNALLGNSTIQGANDLALLLTYTAIIMIFFTLVKLIMWAFFIVNPKKYR